MTIAFSCGKCATRFKVPDRLAGKKARCKKCGDMMRIPESAEALASAAANGVFRMGTVSAEQAAVATATAPASKAGSSHDIQGGLRLAPLLDELDAETTQEESEREAQHKASLFQDDDFEYKLAKPLDKPVLKKSRSGQRLFWGKGGIAEVVLVPLRKVSDLAFLASMLLLLTLLLAIVIKQRELALLAAGIIVLVNIVRLVLEGIVLVALAFKNGPVEGVLFFIPPLTFYYLSQRGKIMKEAFKRFMVPAVPIIGVVLLFIFVPFLRGDALEQVPGGEKIQSKLRGLEEKVKPNVPSTQVSEDVPPSQDPEN